MTKGLYTAAPTGPIWALEGSLLGKSEDHGDSGSIGNDKLRLCKAVPNLYVELRQSVLGVRVPEGIQRKGFRVQMGANLGMGCQMWFRVPADIGALRHPSASEGLDSSLAGRPGDLWGQWRR